MWGTMVLNGLEDRGDGIVGGSDVSVGSRSKKIGSVDKKIFLKDLHDVSGIGLWSFRSDVELRNRDYCVSLQALGTHRQSQRLVQDAGKWSICSSVQHKWKSRPGLEISMHSCGESLCSLKDERWSSSPSDIMCDVTLAG